MFSFYKENDGYTHPSREVVRIGATVPSAGDGNTLDRISVISLSAIAALLESI